MMSLPPMLARSLGRGDLARPEVRARGTGLGALYGRGQTAVGISSEAVAGPARGRFAVQLDTGVASATLLAVMVGGLIAFAWWTRSHQG